MPTACMYSTPYSVLYDVIPYSNYSRSQCSRVLPLLISATYALKICYLLTVVSYTMEQTDFLFEVR